MSNHISHHNQYSEIKQYCLLELEKEFRMNWSDPFKVLAGLRIQLERADKKRRAKLQAKRHKYAMNKNLCLCELKAKAGSSRRPCQVLSRIRAHNQYAGKRPSLPKDLCDTELSLDDSLTVSSDISLEENPDESYLYLNGLNGRFGGHKIDRPLSWTIHILNRKHRAGDTMWFRLWHNACDGPYDRDGFRDLEDSEILDYTQGLMERNPTSCVYVTMKLRGGGKSVSVFESTVIDRAIRKILDRAERQSGIVIPTLAELKADERFEKKGKGFWALLFKRFAGNRGKVVPLNSASYDG